MDKKRSSDELRRFARMMDINKDSFIDQHDLETCLGNLNNDHFYQGSGEALTNAGFSSDHQFFPQSGLTDEKAIDVCRQLRQALTNKKISYREAFNRFDSNGDGFLCFQELATGLDNIIKLSQPVKEKLFALMDGNKIGMVDYPNFLEVIQRSTATTMKQKVNDSFDWEMGIITKIKEWIQKERITVEEAFKNFDHDFDGIVSKEDLKWGLINIIK